MDDQKLVSYMNSLLGFHRHNGIRLVEAGPGRAVVEAGITRDSLNPMGFIHGGLMFTMADMAAGCACLTHGRGVVTLGPAPATLPPPGATGCVPPPPRSTAAKPPGSTGWRSPTPRKSWWRCSP